MKYRWRLLLLLTCYTAQAQTVVIKAGRLIDGSADKPTESAIIMISNGKITDITYAKPIPAGYEVIDLTDYTVLPGLIDAHTHLLSNADDYAADLYSNSSVFRALRAASHLEFALKNGFTTLRDVCTEGTGYSDVDLQRAVEAGFISGPRVIPSTRGIAARGFYLPNARRQNWELDLPAGTQFVAGVDECISAVREQVSRGAQWIKVFADWPTSNVSRVAFSDEELAAIVAQAGRLGVQVAAHAMSPEGIDASIRAGARSIEHGAQFTDALIDKAVTRGVFWCPTITAFEEMGTKPPFLQTMYSELRTAHQKGLKIALGSDAGSFPWKVNQVKELEYYVKNAGFTPMDAIKAGTSVAAELLGKKGQIGSIQPGALADIVAVKGNPLDDITVLEKIAFVMKDGKVFKRPQADLR